MSVWDDPEINTSDNFVKFETVGATVAGTVTSLGKKVWDDGSISPVIGLTTDGGDDVIVTAGQIRLKVALKEQRPEVGDHLTITFTSVEKRAGGKTLKHFDVAVKRGATTTAVGAPPF